MIGQTTYKSKTFDRDKCARSSRLKTPPKCTRNMYILWQNSHKGGHMLMKKIKKFEDPVFFTRISKMSGGIAI
jgi:hypothetical protein